jgi:ParB family chromosome partitioning protein
MLREIPLSEIEANPFQPRTQFDEEALSALVDSIRAVGVLQPVLVRPKRSGGYELIAGERRCRAARRAGLQMIPALVNDVSDVTSLEQALIENLQREELNALDEAAAYQQLIEEFSLTHEEVARRVGRSRVAITNALRLFQLPIGVQRLVREERLTAGHARALLGTPDRELQEQLAMRAAEEGLSVRALERLVREATRAAASPDDPEPADDPEAMSEPAFDRAPVSGVPSLPESASMQGHQDDGGGARRALAPLRPPGFLELEELLADYLDTRVRVEMSARHGRVVIDFATLEDLERIYRVMVQGRPQGPQQPR